VSNKKAQHWDSLALYGESQCCAGINHATARAEQSYIVVWLGGSSKNKSHFVKNQPENY